jgi:SAM-dependent methyltransferase
VIFSDISQELLDLVAKVTSNMGEAERCRFVQASAEDLSAMRDATVDVVTTRSVLIYVDDKERAFAEFHRVLAPAGRLSLFEPINRYDHPEPPERFSGYDVRPVIGTAAKLKALYAGFQPFDSDPMMNFDERDLVALARKAGFSEMRLEFQVHVRPCNAVPGGAMPWHTFLNIAPNPKIPSFGEAMARVLTVEERNALTAHMQPLVEAGAGTHVLAGAYLVATKSDDR